jgi:hypothetical protein
MISKCRSVETCPKCAEDAYAATRKYHDGTVKDGNVQALFVELEQLLKEIWNI